MLKVDGIDVFYGDLQALRGVGFEAAEREVVSVIGSNGAGKSTTLKTVSGILRPRSGTIEFDGENISRASTTRIVEMGISHIPEGRQLFPTMTVEENLEMGAQFPHTKKVRKETMAEVFGFFPRLKERLGQKAGTLSGGEQQMVALMRALISEPRLLLLDEPSLGLSPIATKRVLSVLPELTTSGTSVLLVEQNAAQALEFSDRAYVIQVGKIVAEGPSVEVAADQQLMEAYLGGLGAGSDT